MYIKIHSYGYNQNGILQVYLLPKYTDQYVKSHFNGKFLDETNFDIIVKENCDVWVPQPEYENNPKNNKNAWQTLLHLRKDVLTPELAHPALESFKKPAMKSSSYRGVASGPLEPAKISKNVKRVVSPGLFKSRVEYKDGTVSNYRVANKANSIIVGYFDKPTLLNRSKVLKNKLIPCRTTKFTKENWENWLQTLPFFQELSGYYEQISPQQWERQNSLTEKTPQFKIDGTAFTTVTVNYNWRTACHQDSGDLPGGLSVITVIEEPDCDGKVFSGCYLGYPKYGIAVDVRDGDFLLKDPHQFHCNTPLDTGNREQPSTRLSFVCYYRNGISKCI